MNDRTMQSLHLNIRSTSPSPVHKKQHTSYVGGKKPKTSSPLEAKSKTTSNMLSMLKNIVDVEYVGKVL